MKNWKLYIFLIIISLLIIALFRQCNSETSKTKINGSFEPKTNIEHIEMSKEGPKNSTFLNQKQQSKNIKYLINNTLNRLGKGQEKSKEIAFYQKQIDSLLAINDKMNEDFSIATDSMQKVLYKNAIAIKAFRETFKNDTINIEVNGLVSGEVKALTANYKLTIPKQKEVVFRLLCGGGVGINKELNRPLYKVNLGFQNKKGKIYELSAQQIGNQQYGIISVAVPILTIKK